MFADPNLLGKLAANPRTSKHLADPAFVQQLKLLQTNPQLADSALSGGDARMIDVLGALMGIDMQGFGREEGSDALPPGLKKEDIKTPTSPPPAPKPMPTPPASSSKPTPPAKVEEDVVMEGYEEAQARKAAEAEKKLGAEAYKKKEFKSAAAHFRKAWDLWPNDITFLTNLGGKLPTSRCVCPEY